MIGIVHDWKLPLTTHQLKKAWFLQTLGIDYDLAVSIYASGVPVNGMGGAGISRFVPDWFPLLLPPYCLEAIGDLHDYRYAVADGTRAEIDLQFRQLILKCGDNKSWINRLRLYRIGWLYWIGVRLFGYGHYNG